MLLDVTGEEEGEEEARGPFVSPIHFVLSPRLDPFRLPNKPQREPNQRPNRCRRLPNPRSFACLAGRIATCINLPRWEVDLLDESCIAEIFILQHRMGIYEFKPVP
jgi:hypothetical protein